LAHTPQAAARRAVASAQCRGDPAGAGAVAAATLHSLSVRARAGAPQAELQVLADAAVDLICR